jgi:hypothetical protein
MLQRLVDRPAVLGGSARAKRRRDGLDDAAEVGADAVGVGEKLGQARVHGGGGADSGSPTSVVGPLTITSAREPRQRAIAGALGRTSRHARHGSR